MCWAYGYDFSNQKSLRAGKLPPGRLRMWQNNIKMDLKEIGCEERRWMELAENCP
jgi:hypothetical protein